MMWLGAIEAMASVHRFDAHGSALCERLGDPQTSVKAITEQLSQVGDGGVGRSQNQHAAQARLPPCQKASA
jgi:hypothetical protein